MSVAPVNTDTGCCGSSRRIKVLVVAPTLAEGGAERFASTLLVGLDRRRFDPSLCLFRDRRVYPLPGDVSVVVLDKSKPWHIPRAIARLAAQIRQIEPDLILSVFSHPNLITGHALQLSRCAVPWVARVANDPTKEESGLLRPWMSGLYKRADWIVANSRLLGNSFARRYPGLKREVVHVPNPADFNSIDSRAKIEPGGSGRDPSMVRVLAVGRLSRQKRVDIMIDSVHRLRDSYPVELHIFGDGSLRPQLAKRIETLGLGGRVILRGFADNPYLEMARADLFLLTSDHEGSPNTLIEAQGLGLPAVATDCPYGPSEIIVDQKTGLLVPVGDVDATTEALARLIENPGLCQVMSDNARKRVRAVHDRDSVVGQYEALFLQVAGGSC